MVPGGDHFFSLVIPFFCSFLWECRASGGVLRYSDIGESRHATTNRYKHEPYCTRVPSCTYSTFCDVIRLIIRVLSSRGSIISNTESKVTPSSKLCDRAM